MTLQAQERHLQLVIAAVLRGPVELANLHDKLRAEVPMVDAWRDWEKAHRVPAYLPIPGITVVLK